MKEKKTIYEILREYYMRSPTYLEKLLKRRYGYGGVIIWNCIKKSVEKVPIIGSLGEKIRAEYAFRDCVGEKFFETVEGIREKKMGDRVLRELANFITDAPTLDYIIKTGHAILEKIEAKKAAIGEVV